MDATTFLAKPSIELTPLYVLAGDEAFLKRRVLHRLREVAVEGDDSAVAVFNGENAEFAPVWDEYESAPFFAPRRFVYVETADKFVSEYRGYLEKKVQAKALPATGLLILDVKTWAANTRLAKMVDANSTIVCKAPAAHSMPQWSCDWAASQHQKKLSFAAGQLLVDHVGPEMGLLDQEILKLATYVGDRATITPEDVDKLVGNSRAENTWKIFDLIGQGNAGAALRFLQDVLEKGEEPMRLLGAMSFQLRKLAQATHLIATQKMGLSAALAKAGIPPFGLKSAESQLRHLSRRRALKLYDWLLELNLDLRGNSPLADTVLLERFILRLATKSNA